MTSYSLDDLGGLAEASVETVDIQAPKPTDRKKVLFDGSNDECIDDFVKALKESL